MSTPITADPTAAVAIDSIGAVARQAGLTVEQTQLFRTVSESRAAEGWELTEAELRAGAELAAGRADHLTAHDDPCDVDDETAQRVRLVPAGLEADAAGAAADELISRARTAVEMLTAHRQQIQHRDTKRARDEELSRWHTNDNATVRHATEFDGRSPAGEAW